MPIYYSCVIDAASVVNESGDRDSVSKWGKIARALVDRIEPRTRKSYEHEGNSINYIAESERIFLAIADKAMNTRIIFAFLEKARTRYTGENGTAFNSVLGELMKEYSNAQGTDKVAAIQSEIAAVKDIMMENICTIWFITIWFGFSESYRFLIQKCTTQLKLIQLTLNLFYIFGAFFKAQLLARGDRLEDLVERSSNLVIEADKFKKNANTLKQTMWWKNVKLWLIIILVIIIIIIIILIAVCGITFSHCRPSSTPAPA